nr:hypothetical protein [Litoreibacter ponti]
MLYLGLTKAVRNDTGELRSVRYVERLLCLDQRANLVELDQQCDRTALGDPIREMLRIGCKTIVALKLTLAVDLFSRESPAVLTHSVIDAGDGVIEDQFVK